MALQVSLLRLSIESDTGTPWYGLHGVQRLERGIYNYWASEHPVKRVYVMYFLEGQLEPDSDLWHLHFHLVPRFEALDSSMRDKTDVLGMMVTGIDAYLIGKLRLNNATYSPPDWLNRHSLSEAVRKEKEFQIVTGVSGAAGLTGPASQRPPRR